MSQSRFASFLDTFDLDPKRRRAQWEQVWKWLLETDPRLPHTTEEGLALG